MTAPLALAPAGSAALALVIGIAFGWTLERAGLGNARKLAGQFYFADFTVMKVMFSAIVTAMLGVWWLARLGMLDLARVALPETWLVPQLAGGVLFGAGLVAAGLCPGTSCVAAASGRGDGAMVVAGLLAGFFAAGFALTPLRTFYGSTARGAMTLPQLLHVSSGAVVAFIALGALGAYALAEDREPRVVRSPLRHATVPVLAVAALLAPIAGDLPPAQDVPRLAQAIARQEDHVTALELAEWIRSRHPGLRVLDLRGEEDDGPRVPGAERMAIDALPRAAFRRDETLVLLSPAGGHAAQAWVLLETLGYRNVYFLRGGAEEWEADVLHPTLSETATPAEAAAFRRVAELSRYFGGVPRVTGSRTTAFGPPAAATTPQHERRNGC